MPWCSSCDRYLTPNAATEAGGCPTCGSTLDDAELAHVEADGSDTEQIPWHFWLLVVALLLYLGWRLIQGVAWFF